MADLFSTITSGFTGGFITSLSITDQAVRLVRFRGSGENLIFDTYRELPLEASVYEADRLVQNEELAAALRFLDKNLISDQLAIAIPNVEEQNIYKKIFQGVGIKTKKIVALAEAESLAVIEIGETDVVVLVSSYGYYVELSIMRSGRVLSRMIVPIGTEAVIGSLARSLGVGRSAASDLVYAVGLSSRELDQTILYNLIPVASAWADAIRQMLVVWADRQKDEGYSEKLIERVVVCGDAARIPGLMGYLAGRVDLPVTAGNPWVNLERATQEVPSLLYDNSLSFAGAIGAVLLAR